VELALAAAPLGHVPHAAVIGDLPVLVAGDGGCDDAVPGGPVLPPDLHLIVAYGARAVEVLQVFVPFPGVGPQVPRMDLAHLRGFITEEVQPRLVHLL